MGGPRLVARTRTGQMLSARPGWLLTIGSLVRITAITGLNPDLTCDALEEFISEYGYSPTITHLHLMTGLSRSTIRRNIPPLIGSGRMTAGPGQRTLRPAK